MPMIIDGHNLIGKMSKVSLADPDDEDRLVKILARHLLPSRRKATVVFDKGFEPGARTHEKNPRLRIIFAPPEGSADEIIMDMIKRDPNPKGLTIVSSDNEIRRCARSRRARLVASEDFARKLESEPPHRRRKDAPGEGLHDIDVDEWLDYFKKGRA